MTYSCTQPTDRFVRPSGRHRHHAPARDDRRPDRQVVTTTASTVFPATLPRRRTTSGARSFDGSDRPAPVSGGATPADTAPDDPAHADPGDQTVATPVPLHRPPRPPFAYTAPAAPGTVAITAEDFVGHLRVLRPERLPTPWAHRNRCTSSPASQEAAPRRHDQRRRLLDHHPEPSATPGPSTGRTSPPPRRSPPAPVRRDGEVAFSVDGVAPRAPGWARTASAIARAARRRGRDAQRRPRPSCRGTRRRTTAAPARPASWLVVKARHADAGAGDRQEDRRGSRASGVEDQGQLRHRPDRQGAHRGQAPRPRRSVKVQGPHAQRHRRGTRRLRHAEDGPLPGVVVYRGDANHRRVITSKTFRVTRVLMAPVPCPAAPRSSWRSPGRGGRRPRTRRHRPPRRWR